MSIKLTNPSIRWVLMFLSLSLVLASGVITAALSISAGDAAVADTEGTMNSGLDRCFTSGRNNSRMLGGLMMGKAVDEAIARVTAYFDIPRFTLSAELSYMSSFPPEVFCTREWFDNELRRSMLHLILAGAKLGVTEIFATTSLDGFPLATHPEGAQWTAGRAAPAGGHQFMAFFNSPEAGADPQRGAFVPPEGVTEFAFIPPNDTLAKDLTEDQINQLSYIGSSGMASDGDSFLGLDVEPYGPRPRRPARWFMDRPVPADPLDDPAGRVGGCSYEARSEGCRHDFPFRVWPDSPMLYLIANDPTFPKMALKWGPAERFTQVGHMMLYAVVGDEGVGMDTGASGRAVGGVGVALSLNAISLMMQLPGFTPGYRMYAVQQHPFRDNWDVLEDALEPCRDDALSSGALSLAAIGMSCPQVKMLMGCEFELANIAAGMIDPGVTVAKACPDTCERLDLCKVDLNEPAGKLQVLPSLGGNTAGVVVGACCGRENLDDGETLEALWWTLHWLCEPDDTYNSKVRFSDEDHCGPHYFPYPQRIEEFRGKHGQVLIREHGLYVASQGGYGTFEGGTLYDWRSADGVDYWVRISRLTDLAGLMIDVSLLVPRDEAMKEIERSVLKVEARIEEDKKETDKKREERFTTMLVVVVIVVVCLMVVAIIVAIKITAPLRVLSHRMEKASKMQLEEDDAAHDHKSHLHEIRTMQKSFKRLISSLKEYRNYMPQSLLVDPTAMDDEEEEEEERMEKTMRKQEDGSHMTGTQASRHSTQKSRSRAHHGIASSVASSQKSQMLKKYLKEKMGDGVKKKKMSVSISNVSGWHTLWGTRDHSDSDMCRDHTTMLEQLLNVAQARKGIVDSFCGDRVFVGYNTVKPCTTHKDAAMNAVVESARCVPNAGLPLKITIGAGTGDGVVGNMGCQGMKKFSIISSAVPFTAALERHAMVLDITEEARGFAVVDSQLKQAGPSFLFRSLGDATLMKRAKKPMAIWCVTGQHQASEDEWMYQLEEAAKDDPNKAWNSTVECLQTQDMAGAAENWAKWPEAKQGTHTQWISQALADGKYVPISFEGRC